MCDESAKDLGELRRQDVLHEVSQVVGLSRDVVARRRPCADLLHLDEQITTCSFTIVQDDREGGSF